MNSMSNGMNYSLTKYSHILLESNEREDISTSSHECRLDVDQDETVFFNGRYGFPQP